MKIVHVKEDFGTTTVQQTSSTAQAGKQSSTSNPAAEITVVDDEEGEDMPMLVSVNNGANKSNMVENFKSSSVDSDEKLSKIKRQSNVSDSNAHNNRAIKIEPIHRLKKRSHDSDDSDISIKHSRHSQVEKSRCNDPSESDQSSERPDRRYQSIEKRKKIERKRHRDSSDSDQSLERRSIRKGKNYDFATKCPCSSIRLFERQFRSDENIGIWDDGRHYSSDSDQSTERRQFYRSRKSSKNVEYSNRRRTKIKPDDREISHRRHRRHSSDSEQSVRRHRSHKYMETKNRSSEKLSSKQVPTKPKNPGYICTESQTPTQSSSLFRFDQNAAATTNDDYVIHDLDAAPIHSTLEDFAHLVQKPEQELADAIRLMAEALAANTEALVELRELLANNNAAFEKIANFLELRQKPIPPTKNLVSADEVIKNVKWKSLKYSDCSIFTRDLTVALATNCFFGDSVLKTSSVKRDYPEANIERLDANKMSEIKTIVRQTVQKRSECSDENFELMWSTAVRALQKRCYNLRQNAVRPKT